MKFLGEASLKKLLNLIKDKLDTKVDKVSDKGLSTNDYTTDEKTKLSKIETEANKYTLPVAGETLGGIKSGTDITVDASGNVSVNDDSHNHVISNIDGLQAALDGKSEAAHTHNYAGSDSVGGPANEVKNGIVTRAKLAQDALYSPFTEVSDTTYNVAVTDIGKTIKCTNTSGCTITVSNDVFAALPLGAEIAVLPWIHNDTSNVTITIGSSYYMGKPGAATVKGGSVTTNIRFGMVALKKITAASLLVTGPVD